jgi:hypothetical protein
MQWAREILDVSMKSDTLGILEQSLDDIFVSSPDLFNIFVECAGVKTFSEMSPANWATNLMQIKKGINSMRTSRTDFDKGMTQWLQIELASLQRILDLPNAHQLSKKIGLPVLCAVSLPQVLFSVQRLSFDDTSRLSRLYVKQTRDAITSKC